jgi:hypothetical protein
MKNRIVLGCLLVLFFGFQACQKSANTTDSVSSLSTNLKAAVADVATTNATVTSSVDVQSVSVEKFDGSTPAYRFDGGRPDEGFGAPGLPGGFGPVKFGVPHIDSCVNVTVSSSSYPREIVIDYGTGCTDRMGHTRKGKIVIDISDTITNAGATQTLTYQDFYVDSIKIELTESLKNLGKNSAGNWVIEKKSDRTITRNMDKSVESSVESDEWISGFETTDRTDDIFYESGSGSITINDTATFSKNIAKPLLVDRSCEYIKSGIVVLTKNSNTVTIDYGDGTCDNKATVTINGTTEEIELRGCKFREGGDFGKHCPGFGYKGPK